MAFLVPIGYVIAAVVGSGVFAGGAVAVVCSKKSKAKL